MSRESEPLPKACPSRVCPAPHPPSPRRGQVGVFLVLAAVAINNFMQFRKNPPPVEQYPTGTCPQRLAT